LDLSEHSKISGWRHCNADNFEMLKAELCPDKTVTCI